VDGHLRLKAVRKLGIKEKGNAGAGVSIPNPHEQVPNLGGFL